MVASYPCGVFLQQLSLFGGRLGLLQIRECKGVAFGGDYWLEFCGGNVVKSVTGKTDSGGGVISNQLFGGT